MKLFLDTADVDEIRRGARLGVVKGVTTNPSLAAKAGVGGMEAYKDAVQEIASIIDGPISIEVISTDVEGMITEGKDYVTWISKPWIKLPSTPAGFEAMKVLSDEGMEINQTLCFSVNQALLGAQAGATAVSPFVGRMDDIGQRGMDLVAEIVTIFRQYDIKTEVLAASIRHALHCVEAARAGAHIATIPYSVLEQMTQHPLTDIGVARFLEDWEKSKQG
ncbi:MAG: fructose-6-phosphate aldolase [Dehalococcoidia bacterium]|nr:fructose-6-phosphate aldolase [Chloroflexota bacterium]MCZ6865919.1 fructose-6-phosphate aldolase [Chloroflexota bacterium]